MFEKEDIKKMIFVEISVWINRLDCFPFITRLLKLICVMPSSTSTCERNFSAINFIKNKLRNILGDEFLDDLLLDFLEKDLVNKIINNEDLRERIADKFRDLGSGSANDNISRKLYL